MKTDVIFWSLSIFRLKKGWGQKKSTKKLCFFVFFPKNDQLLTNIKIFKFRDSTNTERKCDTDTTNSTCSVLSERRHSEGKLVSPSFPQLLLACCIYAPKLKKSTSRWLLCHSSCFALCLFINFFGFALTASLY